jgi:hypothetical protein
MEKFPVSRAPILPDRIRTIGGQSFAFLPHRLLREGFLCTLSPDEQRLYLLLVLVADRNGLSFYGFDRICAILEMPLDEYLDARDGLLEKDLLAFDGTRFQVLSLPPKPIVRSRRALRTPEDLQDDDPATIRKTILASLDGRRRTT